MPAPEDFCLCPENMLYGLYKPGVVKYNLRYVNTIPTADIRFYTPGCELKMIRNNLRLLSICNMIVDMLIVIASYILSTIFWLNITYPIGNMAQTRALFLAAVVYAVIFWLIVSVMGMYNTDRTYKLSKKLSMIVGASTITLFAAASILYLFRLQEFSRGVLACFYISSTALLCLKYSAMRWISNKTRSGGRNLKHVLVVGTGHLARQYAQDVAQETKLGFNLIGYAGAENAEMDALHVCGYDELDEFLHHTDLDDVVIALDAGEISRIQDIILICEKNGVKYSIIPFYNDVLPPHPVIETVGRSNLMTLRRNALENYGLAFIKRSFDILASGLGLIIISPLMLILAIGVKLSSPGPILFRQERVGYQRKNFQMLKFRSMRVNTQQDTAWTTDNDPRKTKFGSFIRKCSLDELPQLWNVLRGDMSLVGPRPELPHFVEQFRETIPLYMVKHQVRPGITGWAQVNGYRGDTSIEKRIECDIWYIENWSAWLDIKILFMTAFGGMFNKEKLSTGKTGADTKEEAKEEATV